VALASGTSEGVRFSCLFRKRPTRRPYCS